MKKKMIVAGVASAVLATMPVAGVFAEDTETNNHIVNDNLSVEVPGACTIESGTPGVYNDDDRDFTGSIQAGTIGYLNTTGDEVAPTGSAFAVHCNTSTGTWGVTIGVTNDGTLKGSGNDQNTIAPGTTFSGTTSAWAIKSNAANLGTGATDAYSSYTAFNSSSATTFISGAAASSAAPTVETANRATFNPTYKFYISPDQPADTYTGTVTYTVSNPSTGA